MSDRDLYWIAEADMDLLRFYLEGPCQFDHHGNCQTHAITEGKDGLCGVGRVLASVKVEPVGYINVRDSGFISREQDLEPGRYGLVRLEATDE